MKNDKDVAMVIKKDNFKITKNEGKESKLPSNKDVPNIAKKTNLVQSLTFSSLLQLSFQIHPEDSRP